MTQQAQLDFIDEWLAKHKLAVIRQKIHNYLFWTITSTADVSIDIACKVVLGRFTHLMITDGG